MDAVFEPQPSDEERAALLEALAAKEPAPDASAWREAALREGVEHGEP